MGREWWRWDMDKGEGERAGRGWRLEDRRRRWRCMSFKEVGVGRDGRVGVGVTDGLRDLFLREWCFDDYNFGGVGRATGSGS